MPKKILLKNQKLNSAKHNEKGFLPAALLPGIAFPGIAKKKQNEK